ncbi:unnamed protein product [Heligmosomoides polygyrus]|uniref:DDE_Tnp_1_7 domain-containing protein n=1 Tax=Heligmosomoides polygyrus TaxID=6339 RepID=A0A183FML8_HELPZ|nr:unnamed protein product [Heligmosomoides polygyrus]
MYRPEKELLIDESMVPFRGRVSFLQYNGTKRHRFGIKLFKLCSRAGHTQKVKIYAGKDPKQKTSLAEAVVLELMDGFLMQGRCLSPITGIPAYRLPTVCSRKRRTWWECKKEIIYKQNRKGVPVLKWKDRKDIHMLSTKHDTCRHPNDKPLVVADYNTMKGFVDLID